MARVSFVVTVYNKRGYLPYLLAGLEAQRGDFEREFIFVDDGSTDGSGDWLRQATAGRAGCAVIGQSNQGPARALNRGLAEATGAFIKPMDADDVLLPGATAVLIKLLATTGQGLAFGDGGDYRVGLPGGPAAVLSGRSVPDQPATVLGDALRRTLRRAQTTPSAWLARAGLVHAAGGCDPGIFVQDYSIELRLARHTGFVHLGAPVFLAPEQAPGRLSENQAQTLHDINLAVCHLLRDHPDLSPADRRYALNRVLARAWTWQRRHGRGPAPLSPEFRRALAARLGIFPNRDTLIAAACAPFRRSHPIRLPT